MYMTMFEVITVVVGTGGIALAAAPSLRPGRVLSQLGRQGALWFESDAERSLEEIPSEDGADAPIPRRPLRPRF
jgi:hypothetical protein